VPCSDRDSAACVYDIVFLINWQLNQRSSCKGKCLPHADRSFTEMVLKIFFYEQELITVSK